VGEDRASGYSLSPADVRRHLGEVEEIAAEVGKLGSLGRTVVSADAFGLLLSYFAGLVNDRVAHWADTAHLAAQDLESLKSSADVAVNSYDEVDDAGARAFRDLA
jgi:hypothetical protein